MVRKALLIGILLTGLLLGVVYLSQVQTGGVRLPQPEPRPEGEAGLWRLRRGNIIVEAESVDEREDWIYLTQPVITFAGASPTVVVAERGRLAMEGNRQGMLSGQVVARLHDRDGTEIHTDEIHFDQSIDLGIFTDADIRIASSRMVIHGHGMRGRTDMSYFRVERLDRRGIVLLNQTFNMLPGAADPQPGGEPEHIHIVCDGAAEYRKFDLTGPGGETLRDEDGAPKTGNRIDLYETIRVRQIGAEGFEHIQQGRPPIVQPGAGLDAETLLTVVLIERPRDTDEPLFEPSDEPPAGTQPGPATGSGDDRVADAKRDNGGGDPDSPGDAAPAKSLVIDAMRAFSETPGRTYFFTPDGRRAWGDTLTFRDGVTTLTGASPKAIWQIDDARQAVVTGFAELVVEGREAVRIATEPGAPFLMVDQQGGGAARDILGERVSIDPSTQKMDVFGSADRPAEIHLKDEAGQRTGDVLLGDHIDYSEYTLVAGTDRDAGHPVWANLETLFNAARTMTAATLPGGIDPLPPLVRQTQRLTLAGRASMRQDGATLSGDVIRIGQAEDGSDTVDAEGPGMLVVAEADVQAGGEPDDGAEPLVRDDEQTTIAWQGRMAFRGERAVFYDDVRVTQGEASTLDSDRLDLIFDDPSQRRSIRRVEATGNVRIVEGNQTALGQRFVRDAATGDSRLFGAEGEPAQVVSGLHRDSLFSREIEIDRAGGRMIGHGPGRMRHTIVPLPDESGHLLPTQVLFARWSEGMVYDEAFAPGLGRITLTGNVNTIRLPELGDGAAARLLADASAAAALRAPLGGPLAGRLMAAGLPYDTLDSRKLELFIAGSDRLDPRTGQPGASQRLQSLVAHDDVVAVFRDETGVSRGTGDRLTWDSDRDRALLVSHDPSRPARAWHLQNELTGPELIYSRRETAPNEFDTSIAVRGPGTLDYRDSAPGGGNSVHAEWTESAYYSMATHIAIFVGEPRLLRRQSGDRLTATQRIVTRFGIPPGGESLELRRIVALGDKPGSVRLRHDQSESRGNLFVWDAGEGVGRILDTAGDPVRHLDAGGDAAEGGQIVVDDDRDGPARGVTVAREAPAEKPLIGPEQDDGWKEILHE